MKRISHLLYIALLLTFGLAACEDDNPTSNTPVEQTHVQTPRMMVAHGGKLYVSCYRPASVVRIDTATMQVDAMCRLGNYNPEGIAALAGRLFVVSSWVADERGEYLYDDKVYVVDLSTFRVVDSVTVGINPQRILAIDGEHLIVNYNGDYNANPGGSAIIDANTLQVTQTGLELTSMCTRDGQVYGYSSPYTSASVSYLRLDPSTMQSTTILDGCTVANPYSINVLSNGDVLLTTTGNYTAAGDVLRCTSDGTTTWRQTAGMLPSRVIELPDGTAYVLNEGTWSGNNASLSRVNLASGEMQNGVFAAANGRGLGDVAQDILVYGSHAYITVSFSNTIEAVSLADNTSRQLSL